MAEALDIAKKFLVGERGAGDVLASSSAFAVVRGYEHLVFMTATFNLPSLKNGVIEYSAPTGTKTFGKGKVQTYNQLPMTFMERENLDVEAAKNQILTCGENGDLIIDFYVGDGHLVNTKKWGEAIFCDLIVEDTPEVDSEGSETPMRQSVMWHCHFFPDKMEINEPLKGIAAESIAGLLSVTGEYDC